MGIAFGLLLLLFVISVSVSFWSSNAITSHIVAMRDSQFFTSTSIDEITNHADTIGFEVFEFLRTSNPEIRPVVIANQESFERVRLAYQESSTLPGQQNTLTELGIGFAAYAVSGQRLMDLVEQQDDLLENLGNNMDIFALYLEGEKVAILETGNLSIASSEDRIAKLDAMIGELTALIRTATGGALSSRHSRVESVDGLKQVSTERIEKAVYEYLVSNSNEATGYLLADAEWRIQDTNNSIQRILSLDEDIRALTETFSLRREQLAALMSYESLLLGDRDAIEGMSDLANTASRTNKLVLILLFVGLITGLVIALQIAKGITGPVNKLVKAAQSAENGDLSVRVELNSKDELGTLGTAFDQMMSTIQRAELEAVDRESEQRWLANENAAEAALGRVISSSLDIEEVYESAVDAIRVLIPFDRLEVMSFDTDNDWLIFTHVSGLEVADTRATGDELPLSTTPYASMPNNRMGIILEFTENGETTIDWDWTTYRKIYESGIRSVLGVPLISRGRVFGALSFSAMEPNAYGCESMGRARKIADQIAGAIASAGIHSELLMAQTELILARDRLELRVLERTEELEMAKNEALSASQVKSQFLANMSHELRTPLNAVIGYSELLEITTSRNGAEEYLPDLGKIKQSGNHLLDLVNNILDLSKVESGKMEPEIQDVNISGILDDAIQVCSPSIGERGNELMVSFPDDIGTIKADENLLRQALCNLLSNAAKFTQDGSIVLNVSRIFKSDGEWVQISVSDTGIGIEPEIAKDLFQPFTQADSSIIHTYGGTGLGLVISRRFCMLMGGDVTVSSTPGEGSTFIISLPVCGATRES